ncbi:MAG: 2-succinyl-5-enolpyruvyl-6-hydroxy-3-cyclohexene-1-carboxylic-acid synthase [Cyanobacteria bacterium J06560_2]
MTIDFRNTNSLWASVAVETLAQLGLQTAILCPGSRSTPLTFAFATHPSIEAIPILDERSAAFFALGCAKRQHQPVALVCTSGTAGANFYPTVIEAYESGVPLLIFTADRPPEMRDCASGQTIDQQKLYGGFSKDYSELAVPMAEMPMLAYLRQTLVSGWGKAIAPCPGPIHYNCPFRDPLPPLADNSTQHLEKIWNSTDFFAAIASPASVTEQTQSLPIDQWTQCHQGLIIAGPSYLDDPQGYCQLVSELSQRLGWPVLAEGLSPLRNYHRLNSSLVSTYDIILRSPTRAAALIPKQVIQLGPLPISKVLRQWLQTHQPKRWIVGSQRNLDPLHGPVQGLPTTLESLVNAIKTDSTESTNCDYTQQWLDQEASVRQALDNTLATETALVESKVVWLLSQHLPENTPLFIANSMPVRDIEYFWAPGDRKIKPVFSRGANGIDGTLSTAMGLAHHNAPTVLLTGDLAFLHDTNGLLNTTKLSGHLTVIVINNSGGGIFEMLPVAQFESVFETYFATPQSVELFSLCKAYGVEHKLVTGIQDFVDCISHLPSQRVRVLEVVCDRTQSTQQRKSLLSAL